MSSFELLRRYDGINLCRSGVTAKLELSRPERLNALSYQLAGLLLTLLEEVRADPSVRAVLLTGAGRAFSSGNGVLQPVPQDAEVRDLLREVYHPMLRTMRGMPRPTIAAANGPVAGVGVALALGTDLVLAAESAYFLLAQVNIGVAPDGGTFLLVASRVGFARAAEMAMLGERISAPRARDWGLINQVWPDAELAVRAEALALRMADGRARSYAGIKRELNTWVFAAIDEALELETQIVAELRHSADAAEGCTAFAQKRTAQFSGQ